LKRYVKGFCHHLGLLLGAFGFRRRDRREEQTGASTDGAAYRACHYQEHEGLDAAEKRFVPIVPGGAVGGSNNPHSG
jgi:hypothetical protein